LARRISARVVLAPAAPVDEVVDPIRLFEARCPDASIFSGLDPFGALA
jgi:hypothetical protein